MPAHSGRALEDLAGYTRTPNDLSVARIDSVKGVKRIAAKLAHFDDAYLRFVGDIEISRYRGGGWSRATRMTRSGN